MVPFSQLWMLLAASAVFVGAKAEAAICTPLNSPKYYVGNTGSDATCTDDDIGTAIAKASTAVCPAKIYVSSERTYASEVLSITNAANGLTLIGVGATCGSAATICDPTIGCGSPPTQVQITGNGANPVLSISGGGAVTIANLSISGGGVPAGPQGAGGIDVVAANMAVTLNNVTVQSNSGTNGGGVAFLGSGSLHLQGVNIQGNTASDYGGGVAITSSSGHVEFVIDDAVDQATYIQSNRAKINGGGLYADGDVHVLAVTGTPGRIQILGNSADSVGGGIYYRGSAFADIGMPGNAIFENSAQVGAGIDVEPADAGNAVLRVFTTDPLNPAEIDANSASAFGGGLTVDGTNGSTHATACLFDTSLDGNSAVQFGTAIYVNGGGHLAINPDSDAECAFSAVASLGAVHCSPSSVFCNALAQNEAASGSNAATIDFGGAVQIDAQRLRLVENTGSYLLHGVILGGSSIGFSQCLFDDNTVTGPLVMLQGGPAAFDSCTLANNSSATPIFSFDTGMTLTRSIVQQGSAVFPAAATSLTAQYLMLDGPFQLIGNSTVVYGLDPAFTNAANDDYHLLSTSPAIDFAPVDSAESPSGDFDYLPRVVDISTVRNLHGPRDLGAYEFQLPDRIFMSGFDP